MSNDVTHYFYCLVISKVIQLLDYSLRVVVCSRISLFLPVMIRPNTDCYLRSFAQRRATTMN